MAKILCGANFNYKRKRIPRFECGWKSGGFSRGRFEDTIKGALKMFFKKKVEFLKVYF